MARNSPTVRVRAIAGVLLVFGVVAGVAKLAFPSVAGWTDVPAASEAAAKQALERARTSESSRWAPAAMEGAEQVYRDAVTATSRQAAKWWLVRDFRDARDAFRSAEVRSLHATAEARRNRDAARLSAERQIELAEKGVADAEKLAAALPLQSRERRALHDARSAFDEARAYAAAGRYDQSADRAADSIAASERLAERVYHGYVRHYDDPEQIQQWREDIAWTAAWSRAHRSEAILVNKERRTLTLYDGGVPVATYNVDLGRNATSNKYRAGDWATPEGRYRITQKKGVGQSTYHMALLLDYPNAEDRRRIERAKRQGRVPRHASLGNLIEIHGEGGRGTNWTKGCVALSNRDMEKLYRRVTNGTPVTIVGGDGTGGPFSEIARKAGGGAAR